VTPSLVITISVHIPIVNPIQFISSMLNIPVAYLSQCVIKKVYTTDETQ